MSYTVHGDTAVKDRVFTWKGDGLSIEENERTNQQVPQLAKSPEPLYICSVEERVLLQVKRSTLLFFCLASQTCMCSMNPKAEYTSRSDVPVTHQRQEDVVCVMEPDRKPSKTSSDNPISDFLISHESAWFALTT